MISSWYTLKNWQYTEEREKVPRYECQYKVMQEDRDWNEISTDGSDSFFEWKGIKCSDIANCETTPGNK